MNVSRLSSLLVRDGIVPVKKMEQAFQRQVIYGGGLDTILLEMNAVPEERLVQYLALATGLPAAERDLFEVIDPRGPQMCPRPIAEEYQVAPVNLSGTALRLLVTDPVDLVRLETLATALRAPIQPFVVPEYRFHLVLERLFGIPTPSRYASLANRRTAAISRPMEGRDHRSTRPISTEAITREAARRAKEREAAAAASADQASTPVPVPLEPTPSPAATSGTGVVRAPWRGGNSVDPKPIGAKEASELLARAEDRDQIFAALVRAARSRCSYASLLIVQGGFAFGRVAIEHDETDAVKVAQVTIPLDRGSAFKTVVDSRSPYIGPMKTSLLELDLVVAQLGETLPPQALLMPVVLRERVVAIVYAHRHDKPLPTGEVASLLPLAGEAALSLSRLIVKVKSQGYRKPSDEVPITGVVSGEMPVKEVPVSKGGDASGWSKAKPERTKSVSIGPEQFEHPIDQVLDDLESGEEPMASAAMEQAIKRVEDVLPVLVRRFPGKLWINRYSGLGRPVAASQHGPLMSLTVRLGSRAAPVFIDRMNAEDREIRYYATLVAAEVRIETAIPALVQRLFDPDYAVRGAASDALLGYPVQDIDEALESVRRALKGDPMRARAAAHALGLLRDVRGIPDLIDALERDHTTAEEARRALVELTKQDFGFKPKRWREWWEVHSRRPRIEWMLDGLAHAEDAVRLSAVEELRRLTGEYFGYHHDLPRKEREEARLRWVKWWEQTGRRRFAGGSRSA